LGLISESSSLADGSLDVDSAEISLTPLETPSTFMATEPDDFIMTETVDISTSAYARKRKELMELTRDLFAMG
jgi:hypothetical protein